MDIENWLTTSEAAEYLGISVGSIRYLHSARLFRGEWIGQDYAFRKDELGIIQR